MTRQVLVLAMVPVVAVTCVMLAAIAWLRHLYDAELFEHEQARSREHAALANIGHVADLAHQDLAAQRQLTAFEHDLNRKLQAENSDLRDQHAQDQRLLATAMAREHDLASQLAALHAHPDTGPATAGAVLPGPLEPTAKPVPH